MPWALFDDAPRYHRGTLRAGEVPAIQQRGERVTPAGQAAGGIAVVNVYDQRQGGGEAVQTRQRTRPDGLREIDIIVRDSVSRHLIRGDHDAALAARFGMRPAVRPR